MNNNKHPAGHSGDPIAGDVFHPGFFLAEELDFRGIRQIELAGQLGIGRSDLSLVINGKRNMTVALAVKLEKVLGIGAETWMNLQMRYEIDLMRKRLAEELKEAGAPAKKKAAIHKAIVHHP